ncbi:MAG: AAA family ATPase, partial [Blastocatellia bacterium]
LKRIHGTLWFLAKPAPRVRTEFTPVALAMRSRIAPFPGGLSHGFAGARNASRLALSSPNDCAITKGMLKFPYGIADFHKIATEDYFLVDRTTAIPLIEQAGSQLLFLRPRRFGKSLLLSMLENYYDLARADQFERLFGRLAIGKNPTAKHNQYFVLKWDFSAVNPHGDPDRIEFTLHNYLNGRVADFTAYYKGRFADPIQITPGDALASFQSLLSAVRQTGHQLYLLIDEYDNFANEILMGATQTGQDRYLGLLRGEGILKTIFKNIKVAATGGGIDRVFITGVTPMVLSDMTSGYNVAKNIYLAPEFDSLCGFTEAEIRETLRQVVAACGLPQEQTELMLTRMRTSYNGYRFAETSGEMVYNPTLAMYFLEHFQSRGAPPANLLDSNLEMDRGKLSYIAALPGGPEMIAGALEDDAEIAVPLLAGRFGVEDVLASGKDEGFMASLLYYFGVLTLAGRNRFGDLQLRIPNLVIRKLYAERLLELLLPGMGDRSTGRRAAETLCRTGDPRPLCEFMEQRLLRVLDNRDYRLGNELTIKTAFLAVLFNDLLYIMESETEAGRRYMDLTMIVRPEMRQYQALDILIEFKYIPLADIKLSGAEARALSEADLRALPLVQQKLAEARAQTSDYARELRQRYFAGLPLHVYAIVAIGFDRLIHEQIAAPSIAD